MLKAIRHLDYVVLICDDLVPMRRFYEGTMGFPLHRELGPTWVEFRIGASILALRPRDRPYDGPAPAAQTAGVQLAFRVAPAEVESCHAELVALGCRSWTRRPIRRGVTGRSFSPIPSTT